MRKLFGTLALLLGVVSIAITARYGYKLADTEIDGAIAAVMFGSIALCAFMFDAAAVRLWFAGHQKIACFIGVIAALALVVTFGNSLGGLVSRGDKVIAERNRVVDARSDDRTELNRLEATLGAMPSFTPTDQVAVDAAQRAADAATQARTAECGNGDPKQRGKNCRDREADERRANETLASATAAKASTDRAAKLETDILAVKDRLGKGEAVASPNPLGKALDLMLGITPDTVIAWQSAVIAAVFELCLVGVMVAFEALGHATPVAPRAPVQQRALQPAVAGPQRSTSERSNVRLLRPRKREASGVTLIPAIDPREHVSEFLNAVLRPDPSATASLRELHTRYPDWCGRHSIAPLPAPELGQQLRTIFDAVGLRCEPQQGDVLVRGAARLICPIAATSSTQGTCDYQSSLRIHAQK